MSSLMRLMPRKTLTLSLVLVLSACGAGATRYLIEADPVAVPAKQRLRVNSLELRDVVLPTYGEDSKILVEAADGGLALVKGSEWADSSARAITAELARSLDLRSTASIAAEPWPLSESPDARLEVRIERLVARTDGRFQLSGQYAVSSSDGRMRDFLDRFDLFVALEDQSPAAVAKAYGAALESLSGQILQRLARK